MFGPERLSYQACGTKILGIKKSVSFGQFDYRVQLLSFVDNSNTRVRQPTLVVCVGLQCGKN